jgi:hypothetical protein
MTISVPTGRTRQIEETERIEVSAEYVQVYDGFIDYVVHIKTMTTFHYLSWLMQTLDRRGKVKITSKSILAFQEKIGVLNGKNPPSVRTIRYCINHLVNYNILLKIKDSRGRYAFNPLIIWNSTLEKRALAIKAYSEAGYNLDPPSKTYKFTNIEENEIENGEGSESE